MPLPKLPDGKWVNSDHEKGDVFTTYLRNVFQLISPRDYVSLFRPHQARSMSGYWVGAKVIELFNTMKCAILHQFHFESVIAFRELVLVELLPFHAKHFKIKEVENEEGIEININNAWTYTCNLIQVEICKWKIKLETPFPFLVKFLLTHLFHEIKPLLTHMLIFGDKYWYMQSKYRL